MSECRVWRAAASWSATNTYPSTTSSTSWPTVASCSATPPPASASPMSGGCPSSTSVGGWVGGSSVYSGVRKKCDLVAKNAKNSLVWLVQNAKNSLVWLVQNAKNSLVWLVQNAKKSLVWLVHKASLLKSHWFSEPRFIGPLIFSQKLAILNFFLPKSYVSNFGKNDDWNFKQKPLYS